MKNLIRINERPALRDIFVQIKETAGYLWEKGWAEGSAGNMSVDITDLDRFTGVFDHLPHHGLSKPYPELSRHVFLITATGARMRDVEKDPVPATGLIGINSNGDAYRLISAGESDQAFNPSSELATHMAIHAILARHHAPDKAVVHAHAHELAALTYLDEYTDEKMINELLWSMHPEMVMFLPKGIGFIPFSLSGDEDLARLTAEKLLSRNVVLWEKHGCIASGTDLPSAFDSIDIAATSASIFFYCRNAGFEPKGLNDSHIKTLRNRYLQS
jgi:rhamnulose-1-phosphate aldolase